MNQKQKYLKYNSLFKNRFQHFLTFFVYQDQCSLFHIQILRHNFHNKPVINVLYFDKPTLFYNL